MMLLGFATLGLVGYRRNARARVAAWSEARGLDRGDSGLGLRRCPVRAGSGYLFLSHWSPTFIYSRLTAAQAMRKAASSWRGS